ncbi:Flavin-dependent oxidoreductase, luciferase family (includes alkanesulfonate monooxygenase SsuD and methylene tetrahydromethanopterin reductase) [Amycolatopsis arida]|uniref:Flavin-dependent oxidoreductase, luciferase family (Includes alkanesulfonate monooxygenase SsuD and methylene tetrahydromethanopterin reductase) n=1 Tax=Amycolatopsis arida TaxID=587909 RepID=A0A1I5PE79_9PSEU|nr:LLM class flavin-dependent oxidoreductase [Amycolatopsis arida]TDX98468.1 alkanesulfonate monooxygenase SsuD/methylene tetrahydromethanopterin reductase-like flavin-dependent oxidoreductase (luciferase family) [Amycolatopsis arida]SFP32408.1 Flavin-dependent oxidoreductase, luciferase family (includes alkanesulfonate monooxygenase SsuD and methylene tetrahydromethanopterin reductase) [Amycolatopsis arida]
MAGVRIGVVLPPFGADAGREVAAAARHAERRGLDSVWTGDHLVAVRPKLDATMVLTAAAAATERIRVGFGVLVLALRPVAWAAKQVATLQHLSGGRVVLGVGVGGDVHGDIGWHAAGVPFAERGPRTDAALEVLPGLVRGEPTVLDDRKVTLEPGAPLPPVLVGGGRAALRRALRFGHGWYPAFTDEAVIADGARRLAERAAELDRPAPEVTAGVVAVLGDVPRERIEAEARSLAGYGMSEDEALRTLLTGGPAAAADRITALAAAGATEVVALCRGDDWFHQVELLAETRRLLTTA